MTEPRRSVPSRLVTWYHVLAKVTQVPKLEVSDEQVLELIRQLQPKRKREVLLALAEEAREGRGELLERAEAQLRRRAAERGLEWDRLTEEQRETFVDDLVHEDRRLPGSA